MVVSWTSCAAEAVAGQGERRQVLHAVGEGAEPAVGRRRVQLEMDAAPALQVRVRLQIIPPLLVQYS